MTQLSSRLSAFELAKFLGFLHCDLHHGPGFRIGLNGVPMSSATLLLRLNTDAICCNRTI
jgi:hypothetical protein